MKPRPTILLFIVGTIALLPATVAAGPIPARATWDLRAVSGLDATVHTYPLAVSDTTETITEFMCQLGLEGRSPLRARHRWRLRAEASAGTELFRQRLEGDYRWQDARRVARLRLTGSWRGRQYRPGTTYTNSSDHGEGRLQARLTPWAGEKTEWRGLLSTEFSDYARPSTLEVNHHGYGARLVLQSRGLSERPWHAGLSGARRVYPDSVQINRRTAGLEAGWDGRDFQGRGLQVYQRSQRRLIADETVRPSAWMHWSEGRAGLAAGPGTVFLDLQSEVWSYDQDSTVYVDSWRLQGMLGYTWGDLLSTSRRLGLAGERLAAGDSPESYHQLGLYAGIESYAGPLGGSLSLEFGRRFYTGGDEDLGLDEELAQELAVLDSSLYTDFHYWKIWLQGSWEMTDALRLDLLGSYEPENHLEDADDSALGFGSIRLVWRP